MCGGSGNETRTKAGIGLGQRDQHFPTFKNQEDIAPEPQHVSHIPRSGRPRRASFLLGQQPPKKCTDHNL